MHLLDGALAMALGSWQGLYNSVVLDLMAQRRERELLLLMALATHCDPFGFCFPGRARLRALRHCSKDTQLTHEGWLVERGYIVVTETYNPRHRQLEPDYQVSPRILYVRSEIQTYCEMVFDGVEERNFAFEKGFLVILFSTKDSQPEALPESETRVFKPDSVSSPKTRNNDQRAAATTQKKHAQGSTMRNGAKPEKQPTATSREAHREKHPQAVPPNEFAALLDPSVDNERIAQEIKLAVATTIHQARAAVATYPRDAIVHWLEHTARRRAKGELPKPGGYFFTMLKKNAAPITTPEPENPPEPFWFDPFIKHKSTNEESYNGNL